ncbi:A24 family peptidase C-terminal domain-containing protein [Hyperthermus butylicus]|uniref:Uncharacterized protein n=1 Tax=Hyperthermus butylicus (strain DSM 5456 / JCM 9403 / PLM1-5) TaxID=415426 RepID=A2BLF6_HYPBU|nr:A24 family peptidase C-terminal domain-containing protein [Hyperthermus butylicus]ABM80817.1 hypothetical protein Hbut_0969 [Hyperthermus butylicus DSM 5456]
MYAALTALVVLTILSLYDIKQRELPPQIVYAGLAATLLVRIAEYMLASLNYVGPIPARAYIALDLALLSSYAVVALLGLHGWGDVFTLAIIAAASPLPEGNIELLPPLLLATIYYVAIMVLYAIANAVINIVKHADKLAKIPLRYRIAYLLIAQPIRAKQFLENKRKWWYPLSLCSYKITFNIYHNPEDVAREVREAIRRGCIRKEDTVWATYGMPAVPLLAASYFIALLVGDKPLLALVSA